MSNPLITVLLPTHNRPELFKRAVYSVLNQTYKNFEIVISDDSDNEETKKVYQKYFSKYRNIKYFYNPSFSARDNGMFLQEYDNPEAEYINWLMDDDLYMPNKFEKMLYYYENHENIALVTSSKYVIDVDDNFINITSINNTGKDMIIDGHDMGRAVLYRASNIIGEPTTVLIKKSNLLSGNKMGWFDDSGVSPLSDIITWLRMMKFGDLVYISEPLSCFRNHEGQDQRRSSVIIEAQYWWLKTLKYVYEDGYYISDMNIYKKLVDAYVKNITDNLEKCIWGNYYTKETEVLSSMAIKMLEEIQEI